jgi:hypothetical protein
MMVFFLFQLVFFVSVILFVPIVFLPLALTIRNTISISVTGRISIFIFSNKGGIT